MNKRITSIVLCLALLVSLMVAAVPVSATDTVKFTMTADKTTANVGDTITYTISIGAVENLAGFQFELAIPEGLTFVKNSSSVNEAWEEELDFGAFNDQDYLRALLPTTPPMSPVKPRL